MASKNSWVWIISNSLSTTSGESPRCVIFTGRGTDDGEDFEDWSMHALRERVKLVQELDQLADRMVELALRLTREAQVIEEEYFLPQTRKVLVTTL